MRVSTTLVVAALVSIAAAAAPASPTATDPADVYAAQATAKSESPTSKVKGKAFDRYVSIWFENQDFAIVQADRMSIPCVREALLASILANFQFFAKQGITLTNTNAVTHPSEPNCMSAVGGDYFGLDGDPFTAVPQNISTVVDLLEDKGISWSIYQEDMPTLVSKGSHGSTKRPAPMITFASTSKSFARYSPMHALTRDQSSGPLQFCGHQSRSS